MVSDSDLVTRLREILEGSDLNTATPASVRRQLEADFDADLTDKKGFIREQIDAFLERSSEIEDNHDNPKVEEDNDAEESDEEKEERPVKAKKRGGGGFAKVCQLSPQLEKVLGTSQLARTEVVKQLWAYIREKDLQDPKDRRKILCDETLHSVFRVKSINMFQMNKALTKHIWPLGDGDGSVKNVKDEEEEEEEEEEDEGGESEEVEEKKKKKKQKVKKEEEEEEDEDEDDESEEIEEKKKKTKKQKMKKEEEEVGENSVEESEAEVRTLRKRKRKKPAKSVEKPKRKGGGGFTKVCSLSPELQAFTGVTELARTEVVKFLWSYIKENNMQDPSDKRIIICDEPLRVLFPFESINMFQMSKHLTKHIWPIDDNTNARAGESVSSCSPKNGKQKMETDRDTESDEPEENDKKPEKEGCPLLSPLPLSEALIKFLGNGESSLSRADVVKRLWEYIKENDLQDPYERRKVICDEKLKELFEVDSFEDISVSKLLSNHFIKTDHIKTEDIKTEQ